jgi:hypothetical protein
MPLVCICKPVKALSTVQICGKKSRLATLSRPTTLLSMAGLTQAVSFTIPDLQAANSQAVASIPIKGPYVLHPDESLRVLKGLPADKASLSSHMFSE